MTKLKNIKVEDGTVPNRVATVSADGAVKVDNSAVITKLSSLIETISLLIETQQELISRLAPLAGAMSTTASLRVTGIAMPSTAVTGPITSAQSIAEKNIAGVGYTARIAAENLTATISNINNVTP